jgi:protein-disulfide isomerase
MRHLKAVGLVLGGLALGIGSTLAVQNWQRSRIAEQAAPPSAPRQLTTALLIAGEPSLGSAKAPITIVEFSDFECPYCQRFHQDVLPKLKQHYIDRGLVRFVHKDLPLPFHDKAHQAAQVARCSKDDNQYWTIYAALFNRQNCLDCQGPIAIAQAAGANATTLGPCLKRGQASKAVNANLSEAELQGIRATPTFVIGPTSQADQHKGRVIEGALPWPQFQRLVDEALKTANP